MVGRERELAALVARARGLGAGQPGGLVVVEGEPGIGKTRLVDEVGARAKALGLTVARGAALADAGAPALTAWRAIARTLAPGLRAVLETPATSGLPPTEARWRRFSAITDVVADAAARAPLVVSLDDLHDADEESIELLGFLARDLRDARVLFLATLRDRATRDPGPREPILARVLRDATVIRLAPLAEADVRAMARLAGEEKLTERICVASRGNPLFVMELLSLARAGGELANARVPASIAAALRARIATLSEAEREALDVAALLGADVRIPLVARTLDRTPEATFALFGRAIRQGLLEDDGSVRLRFAHPLFRETLEGDLAADRRRVLHARVGNAMREAESAGLEVPAAEVAHHLAAALPIGSVEIALEWLTRAQSDAEAHLSLEEVAAIARRAADVAREASLSTERRCDLELASAGAASRAGARSAALEAATRATMLAKSTGDPLRMAHAALARGADFSLGVVDGGLVADLRAAREALGERAPEVGARVLARLAAALQPASNPRGPLEMARAAIASARATGDRAALLDVMMSAGSALADYAPVDERRALAREMIALAEVLGERPSALRGTLRLAIDSLDAGDVDGADLAITEHERLASSLDAPHYRWTAPVLAIVRAAMRGDVDALEERFREGRRLAERSEDPNARVALGLQRALFCVEWLSDEALRETFLEVERISRSFSDGRLMEGFLRGHALARRGAIDEARALALALPLDHAMLATEDQLAAIVCETVALAVPERAGAWRDRTTRLADRDVVWGPLAPGWGGPWGRLRGLVLRALGEHDAAVVALERAHARCIALGARPFATRIAVELAETLEARGGAGDRTRAVALREAAAADADALRMHRCAAQARATARGSVQLVSTTLPFTLARDGETWLLSRGERAHRLKDSRGLRWLARLVAEPDRDFHVLELAGGEGADAGDGGELLDARAIASYRGRATELREALEEAEACNDLGRVASARAELDALTDEIARSVGLGSRSRRAAGAVERARVNVQRRLRDATGRIAALDPELGTHLEWAVRTGTLCRYRTR